MYTTRLMFILACILSNSGLWANPPADPGNPAVRDSRATLEAEFAAPPMSARVRCFWWWLNGHVTKVAITRDLEQMRAKGFGGAMIFDADGSSQRGNKHVPAGPMFGSPAWRELFKHAVREADRLGLELSLNIQSGWNLGGPNVTPIEAAKQLTWAEKHVQGPIAFDAILPLPKQRTGFYQDIALVAYRERAKQPSPSERKPIRQLELKSAFREIGGSAPDCRVLLADYPATPGEEDVLLKDVINLTNRLDPDGRLRWDVPKGNWVLLRFGYTITGARVSTSSGQWQGLVVDYMSSDVLKGYWQRHVKPLLDDIGPLAGKTLKYLHTDSWECGGMNWTPNFETTFHKRRGYDPIPFLPVFAGKIVESRNASNCFLADFRKTISDCVADDHYAVFKKLAGDRGLGVHPESGGPHAGPFDALKCLGRSSIPMGEFWAPSPHRPRPENRFFVKQAASAAHIYGKPLVAAEGFTSIGPHWSEVLWHDLKSSFDREACAGLNLTFIHTFTCSPQETGLPGQEYFAGTHFNPQVTWWNKADAMVGYFDRCQFLLQQGQFVADLCYYYGDHVPNLVQRKQADPAGALPNYDYDVVDEEVLVSDMKVQNGRLVLPSGMSYRLLVLPDHRTLSLAALDKLRDLVRDGATIVGPKPRNMASLTGYPISKTQFQNLVESLWGKADSPVGQNAYSRGRIIWGRAARDILHDDHISPDFQFSAQQPEATFDYIHRRMHGVDIYFVSNQRPRTEIARCTFRVHARQPEFWDPLTGRVRAATSFKQLGDRTTVPMRFDPYGSMFIVFRKPVAPLAGTTGKRNFPIYSQPQTINGPWTVQFDPKQSAPASTVFRHLMNWAKHPNPRIRYYSGTATYRTTFRPPDSYRRASQRVTLDLGEVCNIADVRLNGQALGVLWTKPFRVEVTGMIRAEVNTLEIDVVNNWQNRLIGDASLPAAERCTQTNITAYTKTSPLADAGLLGPVRLLLMRFDLDEK